MTQFVYTPDADLYPIADCQILTEADLVPACVTCGHPLVRADTDPRDGVCPRDTRPGHPCSRQIQVPRRWGWRIKALMNPSDYPPANGWLPIDLTGLEERL